MVFLYLKHHLKKYDKNNTIASFSKKVYANNQLLSIIVNLIFLFLVLLFCDIKYEVSDDFVMASIMSGAYGDAPNPQMIFINMFAGYILLPLYKLFPNVSWYFIAQISLIFVSSCIVTFILLEKLERSRAVMLSIMFILFFSNDAYILVQFTKTAMYAIMAGGLLFIWALFYRQGKWKVLLGAVVCLAGTLIRFADIYLAGGFFLFILAYEFLKIFLDKGWMGFREKQVILTIISGCILIGSAFGLKELNNYVRNIDEAYSGYYEYNSARAGIVDAAWYDYWELEEELSAIGVSENDYYMMRTWNFADNDIFTQEKMRKTADIIAEHHNAKEVRIEKIIERLQSREYMKYPVFLACIILFGLGIFLNYDKWWTMLISIGIGELFLIYFCYRERNVYRVEYAVFLGIFLCGIYFWDRNISDNDTVIIKKDALKKVSVIIAAVCIAVHLILYIPDQTYKEVTAENRRDYIINTFYASWDYNAQKYRKVVNKGKPVNGLLEEFSSNKDNFYFMDFETTIQVLYYEWCPWESMEIGEYDNFLYLAGITTNYPDVVNILDRKGLSNPLKSLVDSNVYLVDNYQLGTKLTYLQEHYYPNARAELYKEIDGYQIWKLYKE